MHARDRKHHSVSYYQLVVTASLDVLNDCNEEKIKCLRIAIEDATAERVSDQWCLFLDYNKLSFRIISNIWFKKVYYHH